MDTLTIKIPPELARALDKAVQRTHLSKSELVRRALAAYTARQENEQFISALEQAGDLVGCFKGGANDLASNPRYMKDFGKK